MQISRRFRRFIDRLLSLKFIVICNFGTTLLLVFVFLVFVFLVFVFLFFVFGADFGSAFVFLSFFFSSSSANGTVSDASVSLSGASGLLSGQT